MTPMPDLTPASCAALCQEADTLRVLLLNEARLDRAEAGFSYDLHERSAETIAALLSHARHWQAEAARLQREVTLLEVDIRRASEAAPHDITGWWQDTSEMWADRLKAALPAAPESGR